LHADQRAVLDHCPVDHHVVAHDDVASDQGVRHAVSHVDGGVVLNVGARPDDDAPDVAAQHHAVPEARLVADLDGADDGGVVGHEHLPAKHRQTPRMSPNERH
jgi:hypothetical protein